jgi:hypothetical protein
MCSWGSKCDVANNCVAAAETLGCAKGGGDCQTCALGFLTSQTPEAKGGKVRALHRSAYATLGMLTPLGWKITRPGKGSRLDVGDIVTSLNAAPLNQGIEQAAKVIVDFASYAGEIVLIDLLPAVGFAIERRECERV